MNDLNKESRKFLANFPEFQASYFSPLKYLIASVNKFRSFHLKFVLVSILLFIASLSTVACPVCEKQQPKLLKGITHGAGPQDNWDYLIVGIAALLVVITLFYSIKWIIKPGEKSEDHIKRLFIEE